MSPEIHAKKSLGQNFLVNRGILDKIVSAADLSPEDTVLEVGPGEGVLTELLAAKAGRVIAVEKDHRLIEMLQKKFSGKNVEIIEADILKFGELEIENLKLKINSYKIVGNIPYYITSHLLRIVFEKWSRPSLILFMIQKEVARRICDLQKGSVLSLSVRFYAEPKIVFYVSRGSFRPVPKVDSAILKLTPSGREAGTPEAKIFFKLIKAGFSSPRKKLVSNLSAVFPEKEKFFLDYFTKNGLSESVRAEKLALGDWLGLTEALSTQP